MGFDEIGSELDPRFVNTINKVSDRIKVEKGYFIKYFCRYNT
jgi:ABC-type polar amino acid transport system ATPase subunit